MIYHDIADALTADESRAVVAALLQSVDAHDHHRDTRQLLASVRATVGMAEKLAHGVPQMAPNHGDVDVSEAA